ncbi:hypothetical protein [Polaromonas sp. OV174]|uniref:hypothetical protein n=1 Tax=Polaromonas sp. OV174 TaxID=1855300 RepID=UPI0015A67E7D|nr:hypothetical protein [Polaromonas sp. OV174]
MQACENRSNESGEAVFLIDGIYDGIFVIYSPSSHFSPMKALQLDAIARYVERMLKDRTTTTP